MTTYNFPEVATESSATFKWIADGWTLIQKPGLMLAFADSAGFRLAVNL